MELEKRIYVGNVLHVSAIFADIFRINTHKFDAIFANKLARPAFKIVYFLKLFVYFTLFIYSNPLFLWFAKTNGANESKFVGKKF